LKKGFMTKTQKIWLWVFLGMFILPEVLWSPVGNFVYELSQSGNTHPVRNNFLQNTDNINILSTVLFIQMAGLIAAFVCLLIVHKYIQNKTFLWVGYTLLFLGALITFFIFGISVSLRHFGF